LLVWPENSPANPGTAEIEGRVRTITNRADVRVKKINPVRDAGGQMVAYEVDIE
jgi:hypothetical protein